MLVPLFARGQPSPIARNIGQPLGSFCSLRRSCLDAGSCLAGGKRPGRRRRQWHPLAVHCDQLSAQRRCRRTPQGAGLARHHLWLELCRRVARQCVRRGEHRQHLQRSPRRCRRHRSGQAGRPARAHLPRQRLPDPRQWAEQRARRQSDDGQLSRGPADDAALRAVAGAETVGDKVGVRFGQLAADTEFNTSSYAAQFINGTFGWPAIFSTNLPSGGPAYPFATPGVRIKLDPDKSTSLLLGVFNGDPAGPGPVTRRSQPLRHELPRARPGFGDGRGSVSIQSGQERCGAGRHDQARRLGTLWTLR